MLARSARLFVLAIAVLAIAAVLFLLLTSTS
jgi:hypothetical protein